MRELGDERWSHNDIIAPGLSGLSVRAVLVGAPWYSPGSESGMESGVRARADFFLLSPSPDPPAP